MFTNFKINNSDKSISLKEILDQYAGKYYLDIEYKTNGSVRVFVGSEKKKDSDILSEKNE